MRSVTLVGTAAAAAAIAYYLHRRRRRRIRLPIVLPDRHGAPITIRLGRPEDKPQVASSIADQTGTGSGVGNDDFLLQEFDRALLDPDYMVLYAEDAEGKGLAMVQIVWVSATETYVQMLRVAEAARGTGLARLLFDVAATLTVQRQGPTAIGRWGVVSNNDIMTGWSKRLGLHGPQAFRRYAASASDAPPPPGYELPASWSCVAATPADEGRIWAALEGFPVRRSEFGSQNFVLAGWGVFTRKLLRAALAGAPSRGIPVPPPQLLLNAAGEICAFASIAQIVFGTRRVLFYRYMDGEPDHVRLLLHALPALAAAHGCVSVGGYGPTLPWFLALLDASPVYQRGTATEQLEFHWSPAEFALRA